MKFKKRVVIPSDHELQIDLDSPRAYKAFRKRLNFFRNRLWAYRSLRHWRITIKTSPSPSGRGKHVTIRLSQRMTICERICAQMILGSDLNRETYNFFRYLNHSQFPVLFFERSPKR